MSGASPVLVVTRLDDATADVVIGELGRRSVPVVRLDPATSRRRSGWQRARKVRGSQVRCGRRPGSWRWTRSAPCTGAARAPAPLPKDWTDRMPTGAQSRHATASAESWRHCRARTTSTTRGATGPPSISLPSSRPRRGAGCACRRRSSPTTPSGPGGSSVIMARPSTSRCTTASTPIGTAEA
ncbi:hypothetical protein ACR6C2_40090 [Streptomyces sp. INA 01156]